MSNLLAFIPLLISLCSATGCAMIQNAGILPPERSEISPYGYFERTGDMYIPRAGHTATLLPNGKVLIAGGYQTLGKFITQAELYDPKTGKFSLTGKFNYTHDLATVGNGILLKNGKIFFAGYDHERRTCDDFVEFYNPVTGKFEIAAKNPFPRSSGTNLLLDNGKVFIFAGQTCTHGWKKIGEKKPGTVHCLKNNCNEFLKYSNDYRTQFYDPQKNQFSSGPILPKFKDIDTPVHLETVYLSRSRWLLPPQYIYDSLKNRFIETFTMNNYDTFLTKGHLLPNGKIIFYPGFSFKPGEVFDPKTNRYSQLPNHKLLNRESVSTALSDGNILYTGGNDSSPGNGESRIVELYDHQNAQFIRLPNLLNRRKAHTALKIDKNRVLICGGISRKGEGYKNPDSTALPVLSQCELFHYTFMR